MDFIPLHIYSGYSLLKSGLKIEDIVNYAKKNSLTSIGLCDFNTFSGFPFFNKLCLENNITPIFGIDIQIDKYILSLFIKNELGYLNLLKLFHLSQLNNINIDTFKKYQNGLITIVSSTNFILNDKNLLQEQTIREIAFLSYNTDDFYIGLDIENSTKITILREFCLKYTHKCIAFPHIKYLKSSDAITLEILHCIEHDAKLESDTKKGAYFLENNAGFIKFYTEEEINNCKKIKHELDFTFELKRGQLISYENDSEEDSDLFLHNITHKKLVELGLNKEEYISRLEYELKTIKELKYSDYFLIVADFTNFAKNNGILVGPGRGSAPGSLVSYLLNITTIDPIKYGLIFERFLSIHRTTMPDIDIDFMDTRRHEVIQYLKSKYGEEKVANIITFQTIGAKQSLRDIGRITNFNTSHIDRINSHIDSKYTLRENYKHSESFKSLIDKNPEYLQLLKLASKIEGLPRQTGLHAAGIVLNKTNLECALPLMLDKEGINVEQYDMTNLEKQGFLKIDLLGIRNLTLINSCINNINKDFKINLKFEEIPINDKDSIKLIKDGKTMGIFQLESDGMNNAIKTLQPEQFDDVVALLALFRPGPMDSIPIYAERKKTKKDITYPSLILKKILSPTYGIIVYQEQIMQIANEMANFSLADADLFRRAISKKDSDKLILLKDDFIKGCLENKYSYDEASSVFNLIIKFADYGFNKSHSLSYAIITCRMAYLKCHYPSYFYKSILDNNFGNSSMNYIKTLYELKSLKVSILSPDINLSSDSFTVNNNSIILPLGAIKGLLTNVVNAIIIERNSNGDYVDFFDFVVRTFKYKINVIQIHKMIYAGCFDCFNINRMTLINTLTRALIYAENRTSLGGLIDLDEKPLYKNTIDDQTLLSDKEFELLGMYLKFSPLDKYQNQSSSSFINIKDESNYFKVVCIIKNIKKILTKNGKNMAFVLFADKNIQMDIPIFTKLYEIKKDILIKENIVLLTGEYKKDTDTIYINDITQLKENTNE